MDRDFLEKRKKDLNAYLQVMLLCDSLYMLFFFLLSCIFPSINSSWCAFVAVAAEPRDGEGLPNSDPLRV